MKRGDKKNQIKAVLQIMNLVISLVAFSVLFGSENVGGLDKEKYLDKIIKVRDKDGREMYVYREGVYWDKELTKPLKNSAGGRIWFHYARQKFFSRGSAFQKIYGKRKWEVVEVFEGLSPIGSPVGTGGKGLSKKELDNIAQRRIPPSLLFPAGGGGRGGEEVNLRTGEPGDPGGLPLGSQDIERTQENIRAIEKAEGALEEPWGGRPPSSEEVDTLWPEEVSDAVRNSVEAAQISPETKKKIQELISKKKYKEAADLLGKSAAADSKEKLTAKLMEQLNKGDRKGALDTLNKLKALEQARLEKMTAAQQGKVDTGIFGNLKLGLPTWTNAILSGAAWAAQAYGAGRLIGAVFGLEDYTTEALSNALAASVFVWKAGYEMGELPLGLGSTHGEILGMSPGLAVTGLVVGLIVFELTYKEESKKIVTFECQPWEAPSGGANCEKCNSDKYPCTEYRCKSLGQACELLNKGTGQEKCAWVNPKDVKGPEIRPYEEVLTPGHRYTDVKVYPPGMGMKIQYQKASDGCIKAFTPLVFGIKTNEPTQCKIDYDHTEKFDEMDYYFGGSNLYSYNHTQAMSLPGPENIAQEAAPELQNDGTYTLYTRCKDANGNVNEGEFAIRFCVEKGPDTTPPLIIGTNIENGRPVEHDRKSIDIEVYINEPAECKWSRLDQDYKDMENDMDCSTKLWEMNTQMVYTCKTTLNGLQSQKENKYFFRCKDQPSAPEEDRNVNVESYEYTLLGTQDLKIVSVKPEEGSVIKGSSDVVSVFLKVETSAGYNLGDSWCSFGISNSSKDMAKMFETGSNKHEQRQDLIEGEYTYYFECVDLGGNRDSAKTTFRVDVDNDEPKVTRIFKIGDKLRINTNENSTCTYSLKDCNFDLDEGLKMPPANSTEHEVVAEDQKYYVKCRDEYGNEPLSNECSIIIRPWD